MWRTRPLRSRNAGCCASAAGRTEKRRGASSATGSARARADGAGADTTRTAAGCEMANGYDFFLVYTKLGTDRKLRRFNAAEKWCVVHGVWATAAESPVREYLLIAGSEPATEDDYAAQAGVPLA